MWLLVRHHSFKTTGRPVLWWKIQRENCLFRLTTLARLLLETFQHISPPKSSSFKQRCPWYKRQSSTITLSIPALNRWTHRMQLICISSTTIALRRSNQLSLSRCRKTIQPSSRRRWSRKSSTGQPQLHALCRESNSFQWTVEMPPIRDSRRLGLWRVPQGSRACLETHLPRIGRRASKSWCSSIWTPSSPRQNGTWTKSMPLSNS